MLLRIGSSVLAAALLVATGVAVAQPAKVRNHFDTDAAMRPPGFFDFAVLGAAGDAQWMVLADYNPPSAPNQLSQTALQRPKDSVAAALRRNVVLRDGVVSVGLRKGPGHGGVVLRMTGEKDFLLLLVDLEQGEARLSAYSDGKVTELARGKAVLDRSWGTLSVTASNQTIAAQWDGKSLLKANDPRPAAGGRVGLATAGAGSVAFDEFVIEPQDVSREP